MKSRIISGLLLAVCSFGAARAIEEDPVMPEVRKLIRESIAAGEISGAVTAVGDKERTLHRSALGFANVEEELSMSTQSMFWIASMTKPVTGVAVMMMVEQGKISIDDPVAKYLPEFKDLKDAEGNAVTITIANCLSHTAGLQELSKDEDRSTGSLAELAEITAKKPVKFPAGTQWVYSQTGINVAARVVEVVSGEKFPDFLQKQLFDPLKMRDTTFYPNEEQLARLALPYEKKDGKLVRGAFYFPNGKASPERTNYPRANGGLFTTIWDYSHFAEMLLRGGEWNGRRILKPETITEMTKVRSGGLSPAFVPGTFYGLGCAVVRDPGGPTEALNPGSFGHGGVFGTQAWIDPVKGRYYILMVQRSNLGNGDASELRRAFQNAAAK